MERDGDSVRLITRGGYDWTRRFPWIAETALRNRRRQFVVDGEAVVLGIDGVADFNALHSGKHNAEVQFCAFDVLAVDGDDLRDLPLSMRKTNLERLLRGRPTAFSSTHLRAAPLGPTCFAPPATLVSRDWCQNAATVRSPNWVKVKNPKHPAMQRVKDACGRLIRFVMGSLLAACALRLERRLPL